MVTASIMCSISYSSSPGVVVTIGIGIYVCIASVFCSLLGVEIVVAWESVALIASRNSVFSRTISALERVSSGGIDEVC